MLRCRDANALFDETTTQQLEQLCRSLAIPYSFKDAYIEA